MKHLDFNEALKRVEKFADINGKIIIIKGDIGLKKWSAIGALMKHGYTYKTEE
jgi:2-phospho-L-lactate guanylyltransferase (CobY/MobA/RfbA family)